MGESDPITETKPKTSRWTVRRAVSALVVMALAVPFMVTQLGHLQLNNDVETWLPADDPHARVLEWFQSQFGEQFGLLASWDGSSLNDPRVEAFAIALAGPSDEEGRRHQPQPGIEEVRSPQDLIRRMLASDVNRETAISQLQGVVVGTGPLKVRLTPAGKSQQDSIVEQIRERAKTELDVEITFLPPAAEQQAEEPEEESDDLTFEADEFSGPSADDPYPLSPRHDFQMRWTGMTPQAAITGHVTELCHSLGQRDGESLIESCFFSSGAPVAVIVTLNDAGDEQVEQTIANIRKAAEAAGVPPSTLHLGGSPVGRCQLNREAAGAQWNPRYPWWNLPKRSPVLTSALVGIGLSFIVLQSFRLAILVLITDLYVAGLAVSLLPATGHDMNLVLIVMPNLLIVLTASGAIHIANYWKHAAAQKMDGAVSTAVKMGWQPCVLASFTTAIGLSSLATSVLRPVREFGIFSAIGCLISLAVVLLGFPSMLRLWRGRAPSPEDVDRSRWRRLGQWLYAHGTLVTVSCVLLFAVGIYGLQWFRTETKVIRYFKPDSRIVKDYEFLEENLAGVAPVEVIVGFDETAQENLTSVERMELIRKIKQSVADYPEISGTLALSDFRPPMEPPPEDASFGAKARYGHTVRGIDKFLESAQSEGHNGLVAVNPAALQVHFDGHDVEMPEGAELWRVRAQVALMSDLDYSLLTADLNRIVSQALEQTAGTSHVVTGMIPLFLRTQNAVVESLVKSFGLAFTVIAVVLMVLLRSPTAGLLTMLPNLMPVIVVFGLISLAGVPVDIGTMITASVALGIAVDGTLHLLAWFRDGLRQGLSRQEAISLGLAHCGPAMWQTSAAIGLGLLMLATADLLLISRFGWLMGALIGAALVADIVFLPALLAGPLGTLIERNMPHPAETVTPTEAVSHPTSENGQPEPPRISDPARTDS